LRLRCRPPRGPAREGGVDDDGGWGVPMHEAAHECDTSLLGASLGRGVMDDGSAVGLGGRCGFGD
jgi:hypothetical protein